MFYNYTNFIGNIKVTFNSNISAKNFVNSLPLLNTNMISKKINNGLAEQQRLATTLSNPIRSSLWKQPLLKVVQNHIVSYPTPSNLNISWNWGSLAGLCLVLQILTGICLAMHYTPQVDLAFSSVQHIINSK